MPSKIFRLIRILIVLAALAYAIDGSLGVGAQVVAIVVFLTAYREKAADRLRACFAGKPEPVLQQTEKGRGQTAYHEAGHAVAGWYLPGASKPKSASILPTSESNGRVDCEDLSSDPMDLEAAVDELAAWFAGAAAEREFGCRIDAGHAEDLAEATDLARLMVCEWSFSGRLPRRRYDPGSGLLTEDIRRIINEEIDRFLELGEQRAIETVKAYHDKIGCVAALLLQHGTLNRVQLEAALGKIA